MVGNEYPAMMRKKWLATWFASLFMLFSTWSVSSPIGSSPDDNFHLTSIWCAWGSWDYCDEDPYPNAPEKDVLIPTQLRDATCFVRTWPIDPLESPSCQSKTRGNLDLVSSEQNVRQYPPVYYGVMRIFASSSIETSVLLMRIFNSVIAVTFLAAAFLTVSPRIRTGLMTSWMLLLFPLTVFLISSVNPSSWTIIGVGTFWAFLSEAMSYKTYHRRSFAVIGAIASAVLASSARKDSVVFLIVVSVAVLIWKFNDVKNTKLYNSIYSHKTLSSIVLLFLLSGIFLTVRFVDSNFTYGLPSDNNWALYITNLVDLPTYLVGMLGGWGRPDWPLGLGWFDTSVPVIVPMLSLLTLGYFIFSNVRYLNRLQISASITLLTFLVVFPLHTLQVQNRTGDFFLQPRYLLPLAITLVGVLCTPGRKDGQFGNPQFQRIPFFFLVAVSMMGIIAMHVNLGRYTLNRDATKQYLPFNISNNKTWWWDNFPDPMIIWGVATVATVLLCFAWNAVTSSTKLTSSINL